MIIQNANRPNQDAQAVARTGVDASRIVVASSVEAKRSAAVETPPSGLTPTEQQPSVEHLKDAVKDINKAMRQSNRNLEFSVDADTSRMVVRLTDTETGELIRQIPSDETLAISRSLGEFQQGLLLRQKA